MNKLKGERENGVFNPFLSSSHPTRSGQKELVKHQLE